MVEVEEEDEEGVVGVAVGKINQLVNVATLFSFVFGSFLVSHLQLARRAVVLYCSRILSTSISKALFLLSHLRFALTVAL